MTSSILNIALTGIKAAQAGLSVTANNIANANTVGYSRQQVVQNASFSNFSGAGYFGQGVDIVTVQRSYDAFLTSQATQSAAALSYLNTYSDQMSGLMNRLGDVGTGVTASLNGLYAAMSSFGQLSSDASSRQVALSASQSTAARFRAISDDLGALRGGTNQQITTSIGQINQLVGAVASYNEKISNAVGNGSGHAPNELLDERDQVVRELGKLTGIATANQGGSINVYLSNGQPLVVGATRSKLAFKEDPDSMSGSSVLLITAGRNVLLKEKDLTGGQLGALVQFRDNELAKAQSDLGRIAIGMAAAYNQQQQFGIDGKGAAGTPLFALGAPMAIAARSNVGDAELAVSLSDLRSMTGDDYELTRSGTDYVVTRLGDHRVVGTYAALPQEVEGISISLASGDLADGDSFTIKVASQAAAGMQVLLTDPAKLAGAAPMQLDTSSANQGTASVARLRSSEAATTDYAKSVAVVFTSTSQYELRDADRAVLANGTLTPPKTTISQNGWSFDLAGTPVAGDTFTISASPGDPSGDNRNALAMGSLGTVKLMGGATLTDAYAAVVGSIGSRASSLNVSKAAQTTAFNLALSDEQSNAGVNTDEEGLNLIKYQQAYSAAGKILAMSSQLFDELLTSLR